VEVLDGLSINYILGGSLASSIHGIPRASRDVYLVVVLNPIDIDTLVEVLKEDISTSREMGPDRGVFYNGFSMTVVSSLNSSASARSSSFPRALEV